MTIPVKNSIYLGDCLEIMKSWPDKCVDITVTSPPYNTLPQGDEASGMFRKNGWIAKSKAGVGYDDNRPELEYQAWVADVVRECLRVSKGLVWVNHKTRYRKCAGIHPLSFLPFPFYSEVIWNRGGSMVMNANKFAPSHEVIYGFGEPHFWDSDFNSKMSVWHISATPQGLDHPCPYPISLVAPLIAASCPRGGVVLDPFMGSGTTAVAAVQSDRAFVGCEMVPKYLAIAEARIASETAQGKLF